jgi:hypothetical protein
VEVEPPSTPIDASIWENVLQQTVEGDGLDVPLTLEEIEALREVARRYQGQPLTLEPTAAALVQAVVLPLLPTDPTAAQFWQEAFVQIAQTQLDDPVASDRLHRLWSQLQGEQT